MSIDVERLKVDREYWDEVAPEGANFAYPIMDGVTWYRKSCDQWLHSRDSQEWLPSTVAHRRLDDLIPRPKAPEAERVDGLPPVGSTQDNCSIRGLSKTDSFEVIAHRDGKAIVYFTASPRAVTTVSLDEFRPIRTKEQRDKDELADLIAEHIEIDMVNDSFQVGVGDAVDAVLKFFEDRYNLEPKP